MFADLYKRFLNVPLGGTFFFYNGFLKKKGVVLRGLSSLSVGESPLLSLFYHSWYKQIKYSLCLRHCVMWSHVVLILNLLLIFSEAFEHAFNLFFCLPLSHEH